MQIGDSVVFSCDGKKIEAYLRDIKIYRSLGEYIKENGEMGVMEISSKNPLDFLNIMTNINDNSEKDSKRVRIFEVDYHPYGDGDDDEEMLLPILLLFESWHNVFAVLLSLYKTGYL